MTSNDLEKFVDIMMGLAENYPGTRLTDPGLDMRFEALKKYPIDQVAMAAVKLIKTHRFNSMPTTGDMINAMGGRQMGVDQVAEIEAGKVLDHLHRHGTRVVPSFENPITKYLMGGRWRYQSWASRVQESDLKWWFRDFVRAYTAHAAGAEAGYSYPLALEFTKRVGNSPARLKQIDR